MTPLWHILWHDQRRHDICDDDVTDLERQVTHFVAWFSLDQRRQLAHRDGCICCYTHKNFEVRVEKSFWSFDFFASILKKISFYVTVFLFFSRTNSAKSLFSIRSSSSSGILSLNDGSRFLIKHFWKIFFFQTSLGGSWGGPGGQFWVSGGQLGLKSLSIRWHVSFPRRPKSTSNPFCSGQDGSNSKKST